MSILPDCYDWFDGYASYVWSTLRRRTRPVLRIRRENRRIERGDCTPIWSTGQMVAGFAAGRSDGGRGVAGGRLIGFAPGDDKTFAAVAKGARSPP
ncbi:MAG: hypothetical protein R3C51_04950 [Parvularculaceae bacterium]